MEEAPSTVQEVLKRYTEEDWESLMKRLWYFTYRGYEWLPSKVRSVVAIEDLIQDSIVDVIEGKRHWPPEVAFEVLLCQVIRSKASHIREKEGRVVSVAEVPHLQSPNSEQALQAKVDGQQFFQRIREALRGNKLLSRIFEEWRRDPNLRPREIASSLGLSPAERLCCGN